MYRRAYLVVFVLLQVWLLAPCLGDQPSTHLVILHINDPHGQTQGMTKDGKAIGGYPRLYSLVSQIRQSEGADHVLLFHSGDEFSRGDDLTSASLGQANIALMNQLGFTAWVPGNGDFYTGAANLQKRIAEAQFSTLASNVTYRLRGESFAKNSQLLEIQGIKIGLLGLCWLRPEHPSSLPLKAEDPVVTANRIVPALRKSADVVIALTHLGLETDRKLATSVNGIDLIIGGHSHSVLPEGHVLNAPNGQPVMIAQAGSQLQYLGRIDLQLSQNNGHWEISDVQAHLIPLDNKIAEDPTTKALIARLSATTRPAAVAAVKPALAK